MGFQNIVREKYPDAYVDRQTEVKEYGQSASYEPEQWKIEAGKPGLGQRSLGMGVTVEVAWEAAAMEIIECERHQFMDETAWTSDGEGILKRKPIDRVSAATFEIFAVGNGQYQPKAEWIGAGHFPQSDPLPTLEAAKEKAWTLYKEIVKLMAKREDDFPDAKV